MLATDLYVAFCRTVKPFDVPTFTHLSLQKLEALLRLNLDGKNYLIEEIEIYKAVDVSLLSENETTVQSLFPELSLFDENHWNTLPMIFLMTIRTSNDADREYAILETTCKGIQFLHLPEKQLLLQTIAIAREMNVFHAGVTKILSAQKFSLKDVFEYINSNKNVAFHDRFYNCQHFIKDIFYYFTDGEMLFPILYERWNKQPLKTSGIRTYAFSHHLSINRLRLVEMTPKRRIFLNPGKWNRKARWYRFENNTWSWTSHQNEEEWHLIEGVESAEEVQSMFSQGNHNIVEYIARHHPVPYITNSNQCCICFEERECLYGLNCGNVHHVGMCVACAKHVLRSKSCPYCKHTISRIFPIANIPYTSAENKI